VAIRAWTEFKDTCHRMDDRGFLADHLPIVMGVTETRYKGLVKDRRCRSGYRACKPKAPRSSPTFMAGSTVGETLEPPHCADS
jgi:hypothetical protein